jgi:hypothetical protein
MPQERPRRNPRARASRLAERLVGEENPAGVVYGVIVVGALLAAESDRHESYAAAVGSGVLATVLYWLAHGYTAVLGRRLLEGGRLTAEALWRAFVRDWAIVRGAAIPLLALILAWVSGAGQQAGVTAAVWSAAASLIVFELVAGVRSKASAPELAIEVAVGVAMGVAILALKVILH